MFIDNLAYEASAGSGKTFMLVVRYLSLLFKGAEPSKILALTFTNKAANEMQERIVQTLEELDSRDELYEIAKVTELSLEYLLANRNRVLEEFLNAHTKIMTIDSFFTKILRKFSLYASLMPDFSTFGSQHELKLLMRFLKEVSVAGKKETLITLSLASNKRLTNIFELLDEFYIKFQELKHIEFKKQDYSKFENRAMESLDELRKIISSCKDASSTAIKSVEAENFEELCAKAWIGRETLEYSTFKKCFTPEMDRHLHSIQEDIREQNRAKEQNFFFAIKELVDIYAKSKKALYMDDGELSFSDVTYLVYEILNLLEDSEFLYFRLDAQIEHMLLDEFQDTSILQYAILKPLINEITSGKGIFENGSFFFVGDVKQSIYRFRGGVSALFDVVREQNNTHVEKLLTNYRSQREVVSFVNRVFEQRIKNYTPQLVRDGADGGYVEVVQNDELLQEVVVQVKRLLDMGADSNEIAILCATNGDGQEIEAALHAQNIEVVTETTTKLINQNGVKAILEYLKYQYFGEEIYKENFYALISQEVRSIKRVDFNKSTILDVVKGAIEEFGLFENDFNLLRFLSAISSYSDIEALLFEYERMDMSAAASELSGVRVLTVHKSKGLEYEHVIVMDRLKKAPPSRDAIIYEYEGISLKNIYLRIKGRDAVDAEYAEALLKEKTLVLEDSLNALYVAFTRARENLFIVLKSKDSMFDILELQEQVFGTLRCKKQEQPEEKKEAVSLGYRELYYGTQSDILAVEKSQDDDLKSINFGIALHYMLEMLSEFDERTILDAKAMMINKYGDILDDEEIEDMQRRVEMLLQNSEFISLIDGECYREKAIRYKKNLKYIDLLVRSNSLKESLFPSWNIIDYKSSLSHHKEHVSQVGSYVRAIKEITAEDATGYICYLLSDGIKISKV
ncbi:MAG: RecB-like helicase [Sulfurimonas sp.]|uniref:RecB-like helicase n=1 Tax=Sulfurimonas sp. TaxID=2022749 RepID=UPI0028CD2740|nr:RecB-like helicase [Sulfurimonas sp.]MDT8338116.1 RecB-like helicase [Sulfurimonas sp.]